MNARDHQPGIGAWFKSVWQRRQQTAAHEEALRQATEAAVEIADPAIRQARAYRQALRLPVAGALEYCASLLGAIPGPVVLNRDQFYRDALVNALFTSPEELEEVLRLSPETEDLRKQGQSGDVVALLTMLKQEKTVFGHKQEGAMLVRDVAQQAVSFSDHRVVAAAKDPARTRDGIVKRGLAVLATIAMQRITTLRARKAELQEKREYLKGILKILGGKRRMVELFAGSDPARQDEVSKAEALLTEVERELDEVRGQLSTPEHALGFLDEILRQPDAHLTMRQQPFRLNWMGVRVDDLPAEEGREFALAEFSIHEEFRRSAVLVSFAL
jgi:hypothetical protein